MVRGEGSHHESEYEQSYGHYGMIGNSDPTEGTMRGLETVIPSYSTLESGLRRRSMVRSEGSYDEGRDDMILREINGHACTTDSPEDELWTDSMPEEPRDDQFEQEALRNYDLRQRETAENYHKRREEPQRSRARQENNHWEPSSNPPRGNGHYQGGNNPLEADKWLQRLEKNFNATRCPDDLKKDIAVFYLDDDASKVARWDYEVNFTRLQRYACYGHDDEPAVIRPNIGNILQAVEFNDFNQLVEQTINVKDGIYAERVYTSQ
ncbi:unnamed protein product [Thlaspi arvense]|uniref:Uncharacterized protein n=1 Tax=Thlaspi arvense TaxID=13288 RepID=A0AAU9SE01_THLAR|nr:unnamed protein product [Thlaspi arvense]